MLWTLFMSVDLHLLFIENRNQCVSLALCTSVCTFFVQRINNKLHVPIYFLCSFHSPFTKVRFAHTARIKFKYKHMYTHLSHVYDKCSICHFIFLWPFFLILSFVTHFCNDCDDTFRNHRMQLVFEFRTSRISLTHQHIDHCEKPLFSSTDSSILLNFPPIAPVSWCQFSILLRFPYQILLNFKVQRISVFPLHRGIRSFLFCIRQWDSKHGSFDCTIVNVGVSGPYITTGRMHCSTNF